MSSESGNKLSMAELKSRQLMNAAKAKTMTTQVVLTDGNWGALINSIQLLTEATAQNMSTLESLATEDDVSGLLADQVKLLQKEQTLTLAKIEDLLARVQAAQKSQSESIKSQAEKSISEISSQAGRAKESFSSACSEMKDDMKRWLKKVMWITLIPSGLVCVLELLRLILSAV